MSRNAAYRFMSACGQALASLLGLVMMGTTASFALPALPLVLLPKLLSGRDFTAITNSRLFKLLDAATLRLARRVLRDPRDRSFMLVSWAVCVLALAGTVAILLAPPHSKWLWMLARNIALAGCQQWAFTAKHIECHRKKGRLTYKPFPGSSLLERINEHITGVVYGNIPGTDYIGHGYLHHRNDTAEDDWGTVTLDRSSFRQFCAYVVTAGLWHNSGVGIIAAMAASCSRWRLLPRQAARILLGMLVYYTLAGVTLVLGGFQLFLFLFLMPFIANVGFSSGANYSWHLFAKPEDPTNFAAATITLLHWPGDLFGEGFHLTHHLHPAAHHSEMPALWRKEESALRRAGTVVLTSAHPLEIWALAMTGRCGALASLLSDHPDSPWHGMGLQEKTAYVRRRLMPALPAVK